MIKNEARAPSGTKIMISPRIRVRFQCVMKDQGSF